MKVHTTLAALCGTVFMLFAAARRPVENWNQWRGPQRSGHTDQVDLTLAWDGQKEDNELWEVAAD